MWHIADVLKPEKVLMELAKLGCYFIASSFRLCCILQRIDIIELFN